MKIILSATVACLIISCFMGCGTVGNTIGEHVVSDMGTEILKSATGNGYNQKQENYKRAQKILKNY